VSADVDGSTAEKAYTITTTQGLDLLAKYVNSGNDCSNVFFQLDGPIEYTHTTAWNDATSEENNFTPRHLRPPLQGNIRRPGLSSPVVTAYGTTTGTRNGRRSKLW
jgi:hypothetical protein